jgi:hypothetical protein
MMQCSLNIYLTCRAIKASEEYSHKKLISSPLLSLSLRFSSLHNSFNKLLLQKEELEQKHVHLLQVVESEKTAKWQYTQQCEELASEIRKLRAEVNMERIVCVQETHFIIIIFIVSHCIDLCAQKGDEAIIILGDARRQRQFQWRWRLYRAL